MNFRFITIAVALFCSSCIAQSSSDKLVWKEFLSSEAGIKASLPCNPKANVEEDSYPSGKQHAYTFLCEVEGMRFRIVLAEHNPELKRPVATFLGYAEGDFELAMGGKDFLHKKETIVLDGFDAHRYEVRRGNATFLSVVSATERGALTAMVGPFGATNSLDRKRAEKFIESIHFVK